MEWFADAALERRYRLIEPLDPSAVPALFAVEPSAVIALVPLPPEPSIRELLAQRLLATAEATATLRHPDWARVIDAGRIDQGDRSAIYVVRERLGGETLRAILQREHVLPPERAVHIVRSLLRPLSEAAGRHIVHGDLDADRVWLTRDGAADRVRLADPALADCVRSTIRSSQLGDLRLRAAARLPPELTRFEPADTRSDIHALGRLLYELATGSRRGARVPVDLRDVIRRCLAPDPGARFAHVEELARALEGLGCFEARPGTGRRLRRRSDPPSDEPLDRSPVVLTVVHHPDKRWIGAQAELPPGETVLGREHDPFGGALGEHRVSRRHARLELAGRHLRVTDESRNGTIVNGQPAKGRDPAPLDLAERRPHVVRMGEVVVLVRQGVEPTGRSPENARLVGISDAMERVRVAVRRAAPSDDPVLVLGEPGSGRRLVAAELHEHSARRARSLVTVDCAASDARSLRESLLEGESLRATLRGRTLLLTNLDQASEQVAAALPGILLAIDRSVAKDKTSTPRWLATAGPDATHIAPDLRDRLGRVSIRVPSLAERPEDIPILARHHLRAASCDVVAELAEALLAVERWPENVRSLVEHVGALVGTRSAAQTAAGPEYVLVAPPECRTYAAGLIRVVERFRRVVFWAPDEYEARKGALGAAKVIFVGGDLAASLANTDAGAQASSAGTRWGVVGTRAYVAIHHRDFADPDAEALELEVQLNGILQLGAASDISMLTDAVFPEGRKIAADFVVACPLYQPIGRPDPRRVLLDRRYVHTIAAFLRHGIERLEQPETP